MNKRIRNKKWKQKRNARRKYIKSICGKVDTDEYMYALMSYSILYGNDDFLKEYNTPYRLFTVYPKELLKPIFDDAYERLSCPKWESATFDPHVVVRRSDLL